jgi:hypothetical protein
MPAMRTIDRRATMRVNRCLVAVIATVVMACGEPTSVGERSSFTADITGARNERLTGTAMASSGGSWARESVVQVTFPDIGTFSGIVLAGSDLKSTISLIRSGTELPAGTHRLGRDSRVEPGTVPTFTAGYVVREGENLHIFMADSGSLTIAETGARVTGSFTLHVSRYSVMKAPTRDQIGQVITPIGSGTAPLTITGSFNAGRR